MPLSQTQHGMATQDHNAGSQRRLTTQQFLLFDGTMNTTRTPTTRLLASSSVSATRGQTQRGHLDST